MIGIIADTHDNIPGIKKAVAIFKDKKVDLVLHLGDVIAPGTIKYFKGLNIKFLKGNCDGDVETMKKKIEEIGGEFLGDFAELEIEGKRFALTHKPNEELENKDYDYVLHAHIHQMVDKKVNNTRVISPGGQYLGNDEHSIALLDVANDKLEFVSV